MGEGRSRGGLSETAREIAENLHRSDLDALERAEQTGEFSLLMGRLPAENVVSGQVVQKLSKRGRSGEGRPQGGVAELARKLGRPRKDVERDLQINRLTPEAKQAAREHKLTDNRSALLTAAKAPVGHKAASPNWLARGIGVWRLTICF